MDRPRGDTEVVDGESGLAERTFLIADIRGYTRFTRERGDSEAARLAQSFAAGQTWVVPVTLRAWEAAACRIANRNLTPAEWNEFLRGRPYRRFCP